LPPYRPTGWQLSLLIVATLFAPAFLLLIVATYRVATISNRVATIRSLLRHSLSWPRKKKRKKEREENENFRLEPKVEQRFLYFRYFLIYRSCAQTLYIGHVLKHLIYRS